MANLKHVAIVTQGRDAIAAWREKNPDILLDLSEVDLGEADLGGADLSLADLSGANLREANLRGANLHAAILRGAELGGANLIAVNLSWAILKGAFIRAADLFEANLNQANLDNAHFEDAKIGFTILANVDLSNVKGLEAVKHRYPSSIGIDTLYKSQGKIPEEFLRGCGVPEDFITYLPSLLKMMQPI